MAGTKFTSVASGVMMGCMLGCSASFPEAQSAPKGFSGTYVPSCNVYTPSACFGTLQGETVTMTFPVDFFLYEVELAEGLKAVVYSGFHPHVQNEELDRGVESCEEKESDQPCSVLALEKTSIEAIYYPNDRRFATHVLIEGGRQISVARARQFISSFRSCRPNVEDMICETDPMFRVSQADPVSEK